MNRARRVTAREIIGNLMAFTVIMSPASFAAYAYAGSASAFWACICLAPAFLLLYAVRCKSGTFFLFVAAHILYLALPLLMLALPEPPLLSYAWLQMLALIFVIVSVYCHYKGEPVSGKCSFGLGTILTLALSLLSSRVGLSGWAPFSIGLVLILSAGLLKLVNMQNLDNSLETLAGARKDMDCETMYRFHHRLLIGFIGFMTFAAAFATSLAEGGLLRVLAVLRQSILRFLRWLGSLFQSGAVETPTPEPVPEQAFMPAPLPLPSGQASPLAQWVERIVMVLIYVLVAVMLAGLIAYAIFRFYKSFAAKTRENGDIIEHLRREDILQRIARRAFFRDFGQGGEKKIRKLYYRTVSRQKKAAVNHADTTRDILRKLSAHMDIKALTHAYESKRYGKPPT